MTTKTSAPHLQRAGLMSALREMIDAIDRRVPQIERAGEMRIAHEALVLRSEAARRLEELERTGDGGYDEGLVAAIMTDDGG